jgi:type IV secretion system protein VirD4
MGTGTVDLHRARFAQWHELRELFSKTLSPDGVLLGTRRDFLLLKRLVMVRPTQMRREIGNLLIVAPTRAGKGLLAISQLLTWKHSVIVNDIKGELFAATAGYRATLGEVYVLDPTGVGHCYNPLQEKRTEDAFLSAAKHLLYQPDERDKVFTQRAIGMLARLFAAARREGYAPLPYVRFLIESGLRKTAGRLNTVDPRLAARFLYADFAEANFENKFLVSAWETLTAWLEPLLTETVIRSLTHSDFTAEQIMRDERPVTIYLRWKEQDLLALAPLVRLLWGSLMNELLTTYDTNQGNSCKPVLLLIDEAGRTAIPSLADYATTVVGRGISLWVAVQSLSQLEAAYGRAHSHILRDNMETQLYYRPADLTTAEYLERCLGRQSAYAHSQTRKDGEETSQGLSEQGIPLMTAQEIRQMKDEEIIGFHRDLLPFMLKRMDWRNHPELQHRRSLPAPELPMLPPITDIPEQPEESQTASTSPVEYINPDRLYTNGETTLLDHSQQEQDTDQVN